MTEHLILDTAILQETKATMKAKFPTIVEYFLEDSESYIGYISDAITNETVEKIVSPAHTLKSSAKQMGAIKLSETAKKIELSAREQITSGKQDINFFKPLLPILEEAFTETQKALAEHLKT